jgi:arylsulfatase A-like enzyme
LQRLTADVIAHPRGYAFFAHLMVPHHPYVYDEHCALLPRTADWLTNHIAPPDSLVYNTAQSRAQKYDRYADQVRCALTMLDGFFDALDERGLLADATIVINGDHGSRIPEHFPNAITLAAGVLTEQDYRDTFSTLYAIKAPGVLPAYVQSPAPLVALLDHHLGGEPLREESSCRVFLIDGDASGALTTVEPRFCARETTAKEVTENSARDY